jgi:mycothiol synthase
MSDNSFTIRNYRPSDFDNYARLHIETETLDRSERHVSKQQLTEDLGHPSFHPEDNLFLAERGEKIIGCVSVFLEPGIGRALMDCLIHPQHRKKGIASELFWHAIQHAKTAGSRVVQICIPEINIAAKNMASRLGLRFIRPFIEMRLDLNNIQLPDVKPAEYIIRSLRHGEVDRLTDIQNRSFADAWGFNPNTRDEIAYRINLSSCSPEDIIMVYLADKPVGYCWTRRFIEEESAAEHIKGEIHMIGVDPDFRRQGIGRNVLLAGLSHLKRKGITIVGLTADGEDRAAHRLYESVGFKEGMITQWYEKKLV